MTKPYAPSAEENKAVIFDAIEPYLDGEVLEIGSGTGQHAVYFAGRAIDVAWQPSELAANLPGIRAWIDEAGVPNVLPPIELDVRSAWPRSQFDFVFTANTFHIMDVSAVAATIAGAGRVLRDAGHFAVYGPFNYGGRHTSESNARFDAGLKAQDPAMGIRDFDWLDQLAQTAGMRLAADVEMPVNNRTLIWQKRTL